MFNYVGFLYRLIVNCTFSSPVSSDLPYLIVSNTNIIHQISLDGTRSHALVSNLKGATALDYDYRYNQLLL